VQDGTYENFDDDDDDDQSNKIEDYSVEHAYD
jgi:hypothetical protein